jgi:diguanylate cyclase (GGDEF)-like protein
VPLVIPLQRSLRHAHLVSEARVDGKTGLLNDTAWRREAAAQISRAAREGTPVAVGIMDIDHFKAVNDTYGHPAGDEVLRGVAAATMALLRDYDVIGRVGGEEFAFVLPGCPAAAAVEIAERLRGKIPRLAFPPGTPGQAPPCRVTVSIGIAAGGHPGWNLGAYYALADQALYAAKQNGRDSVWAATADQDGGLEPRPAAAVAPPRAARPVCGTGR